jgi:hypothetical protein
VRVLRAKPTRGTGPGDRPIRQPTKTKTNMLTATQLNKTTVTIDSSYFYFAHGRSPRGTGAWAFAQHWNERDHSKIFWAPGCLSYKEAKKAAQAHFAAAGVYTAYVLS